MPEQFLRNIGTLAGLHDMTSQKGVLFITTALKTTILALTKNSVALVRKRTIPT
jgi:hypothetical protein